MELEIFEDHESLSKAVALAIIDCVRKKPTALLCFASGDTPRKAYCMVGEEAKRTEVDFSRAYFIGLDEWLGIPPANRGSCHYFLEQFLFHPLGLNRSQYHLFDALSSDPEGECDLMNRIIQDRRGIDLMVVGVGMNGHIGFNEPHTDIHSHAHISELEEITRSVGQKYFTQAESIARGITVGLGQVMEAGRLIMMANGKKKAPIIKKTLEGVIGNQFPASLLRRHKNSLLMIDREAASELHGFTPQ